MVLAVLRPQSWERFPAECSSLARLQLVHPYVSECHVLQRMGNNTQGMEGLLEEDNQCIGYWSCRAYSIFLPPSADQMKLPLMDCCWYGCVFPERHK